MISDFGSGLFGFTPRVAKSKSVAAPVSPVSFTDPELAIPDASDISFKFPQAKIKRLKIKSFASKVFFSEEKILDWFKNMQIF